MSIDPTKIQMSSKTASLKLAKKGTGNMFIPSTATSTTVTATIPHTANTDNLIWQVVITWTIVGIPASQTTIITPWSTGDGRLRFSSRVDSTNLYIIGYASTAGSPTDDTTADYFYRVLVP